MTRQKTENKIENILGDLDDNEYLVVRNPQSKRIVHIIGKEKIEHIRNSEIYASVCKNYKISGTSDIRLNKEFSELSDVMTRSEIEDDYEICGNCANRL